MKTKSRIKVTWIPGDDVQIVLSLRFRGDDPRADNIYRGIGLCLKEAFTPEEAAEFIRQFEREREGE